jgi:hypothetical protein
MLQPHIYIRISCSFIFKQFKLNLKYFNNTINIYQSINVQMSVQNLIQNTDTNLSGSKFPSNHRKVERSPRVMIFTHACGTVTVAQLSSGRCRYDPHFPSMYMFIMRSLLICCRNSGKFRSNMGADVSTIKKHLQQIY